MARQIQTTVDAPPIGSTPLKNAEHEKLAREHAAGASMAEAWRAIGRDPAIGNQSRTFRRPEIQARVEYLRGEFNRMAGISLAALQARLLRIADANVVEFFQADASGGLRLRNLTELPSVKTGSIAELQVSANGAIKLKTADKLHAIDSLIKTIGGFAPDGAEEDRGLTLEQLIMQAANLTDGRTVVSMQAVTDARPREQADLAADEAVSRVL